MASLDDTNFPYGPAFPAPKGKNYPNLVGHVFQPTRIEYEQKRIELMYSPVADHYVRCDELHGDRIIKGYEKLSYAESNTALVRDEVSGINYIGRRPDSVSSTGRIDWRFDFTRVGLQVRSLQVRFPVQSFGDAVVSVGFYGQHGHGELAHVDISEAVEFIEIPEAVGWREFVMTCEFEEPRSEVGWSKAQALRQQVDSEAYDRDSLYPFRMVIDLGKVEPK